MELRDLYDISRKPTGEIIKKGDKIPDEKYILVTTIFIQNSKGEFLIQKRSESHDGKFGTTGGHAKHGETSKQALITEVHEELGIILNPTDFRLIYSGVDKMHKVLFDVYYMKKDLDIKSLTLQKEEVDYVEWYSFDKILVLASQGLFLGSHLEDLKQITKIFLEKDMIG